MLYKKSRKMTSNSKTEKFFKDMLKAFNNFKNKQKACEAVYFQKVY